MKFTKKQGQYLAFIYSYTKIHGQPPAERDMQMYFRVTPTTIHQMVMTLEKNGLISRIPRTSPIHPSARADEGDSAARLK